MYHRLFLCLCVWVCVCFCLCLCLYVFLFLFVLGFLVFVTYLRYNFSYYPKISFKATILSLWNWLFYISPLCILLHNPCSRNLSAEFFHCAETVLFYQLKKNTFCWKTSEDKNHFRKRPKTERKCLRAFFEKIRTSCPHFGKNEEVLHKFVALNTLHNKTKWW